MTPHYNFNDSTHVAHYEAEIRRLIALLPVDEQLAELIILRDNLSIQQQVAADCAECHLEMLAARLEIVVNQ